jgi:dTDP-glucose 4,6-dehydratase
MAILVTGGSGFIGSNLVSYLLANQRELVINFDKLTYASDYFGTGLFLKNTNYAFVKGDICDSKQLRYILDKYKPHTVFNLAAETHVDRSIKDARVFLDTNVIGTYAVLEACRAFYDQVKQNKKQKFRLMHISTDEVYGSLNLDDNPSTEADIFRPNNPYSASKASSNHLARAWSQTYSLPIIVTNCSNNYGPRQHPEKLIPLAIYSAITGNKIPLYGDGQQVRDWLYVDDHCEALAGLAKSGVLGETYNIGGGHQITNFKVITKICEILDNIIPSKNKQSYTKQIEFVKDRPGHDERYDINWNKINKTIGWKPSISLEEGLSKTINWYLKNQRTGDRK